LKKIKVYKGQVLQRNCDSTKKIYIVESGMLRGYTICKRGKEHVLLFASEGWTIGGLGPRNKITDLFIDAIEDSIIWQKDEWFENQTPPDNDITKILRRVEELQRRVFLIMSATPLERYNDFLQNNPNIAERVPQKMIASY
jgi:CRP-like cAMP-binding protein